MVISEREGLSIIIPIIQEIRLLKISDIILSHGDQQLKLKCEKFPSNPPSPPPPKKKKSRVFQIALRCWRDSSQGDWKLSGQLFELRNQKFPLRVQSLVMWR